MPSLMGRAAKTIQRQNARLRNIAAERRAEMQIMRGVAAAGVGAAGAALIDAKWGTAEGPAEVLSLPINALAGTTMAVGALAFKDMPMRIEVGAAGLAAALCAGYRYISENVDFGEE